MEGSPKHLTGTSGFVWRRNHGHVTGTSGLVVVYAGGGRRSTKDLPLSHWAGHSAQRSGDDMGLQPLAAHQEVCPPDRLILGLIVSIRIYVAIPPLGQKCGVEKGFDGERKIIDNCMKISLIR